ncbi:peptidoglycan-binding protein [Candidatus Nomurabacteria bacterium]|nr:peptidoglycan-binding protein [Candidatus Nomurabacteria bacterium]
MKKLSMFLMFSLFLFVGVHYANAAAYTTDFTNCVKTSTNPCTNPGMEQLNKEVLGNNNSGGMSNNTGSKSTSSTSKNTSSSSSSSSSKSSTTSSNTKTTSKSMYKMLKYGMSGQEVTDMQNALIAKKHLKGTASNKFDSATLTALKAFQKAMKLKVDGIAGDVTLAALFKK